MSTISRWTFWIQVCYCSGYRYKWRQSYIITITTLSIGFVPLCIFFLGTFFFASPWYQAWMDTGKKGLNHVKSVFSLLCCPVGLVTKSCLTLCNPVACDPTRLLCHGVFSGKSTRVGCHFLLQGIFPTQGSNFGLLHWKVDSLLVSNQKSPVLLT